MFDDAYPSVRPVRRARRRRPRGDLMALTAAAAIVVGALPRFSETPDTASHAPRPPDPSAASQAVLPAATGQTAWLFDPNPALGARTQALRQTAGLGSAFEPEIARPPTIVAALVEREPVRTPRPLPVQQTARFVQTVPLPVPRPAELRRGPVAAVARLADKPLTPAATAAARENEEADRSFFDTVFGAKPAPAGPALAYAGVDTDGLGMTQRRPRGPVATPQAGMGTAVYDISASRVTLPSGEVLEAHSGLGAHMDNPNGVHLRMRGATPPGTYDLTEREALFHGVRALRLNPVGGAGAIYNRNGLLTHTYMLGSSGASNGCISFRNYNRFLQAYLSGEVRRVVVVAGAKQDGFPAFAGKLFGRSANAD